MAETTRSSKPIFSRAANSKTVKDYLAQLDEITRRNKGGFSAVAEETGSSIPFMVPGRAVKSGVPEMPNRRAAELPQPEEYQIQPQAQLPEGEVQGAQGGVSVNDFVGQLGQVLGTGDSMYVSPVDVQDDGGAIMSDGSVAYSDGSVVTQNGQRIYAVGSLPGGGLMMSDGSQKFFDPSLMGIQGFSEGLFGQALQVTQPYGVYNPVEPSAGNINTGTDLRTKNLQSKAFSLPVETKVLEILQDDGTRFGDKSGHQGYGNSVLLQLPTGEVVRLSHLSDIGDLQVGGTVPAGTYVGTTGQTGNTYGEHLDVEYYNQDGQLSDLSTFSGFTQPETLQQYVQTPTQAPISNPPQNISQPPQQQQPTQPAQQPQQPITNAQSTSGLGGSDKLKQAAEAFGYTGNLANPTLSAEDKTLAKQESDKALTGLGFDPRGTVGAQELLMGDLPAAGREASQTIERLNPTPQVDLGISEILRGDVAGAKKVLGDTASRVVNKVSEVIAPKVGAVENTQQADAQSDEGIKRLQTKLFGQGGSGVNIFSKPNPEDISGKRAVGDQSLGGSLLPAGFSDVKSENAASTQNDIRDPFFKTGQNEKYGVKDTAGGALSLDLFSPEFFQDPNNIQSVFKGTQFETPANAKYQAFVEEQRRIEEEARARNQEPIYQSGGQSNQYNQSNQSNQGGQSYDYSQAQSKPKTSTTSSINKSTPISQGANSSYMGTSVYIPPRQSTPAPQPQQNIFQKVGSAITNSNLFKKWFQ